MKILTLVRHAKSSWTHHVTDLERPIKKRGMTDVMLISNDFSNNELVLDAVFSSPAKRSLETCNIFFERIKHLNTNVIINSDLYDFSGSKLINFIKSIDNKYNNVMLFGHNNALTNFINVYGDIYIDNLPTSGLAKFEFDIDAWKNLKPGKVVKLLIPKNLR